MNAAYNPATWSTFFSAQVSAAAALTGLIFVAVSINLVARAANALFTLLGVLLVSTLCLVPAQSPNMLGSELALLELAIWIATTVSQRAASRNNLNVSKVQKVLYAALTLSAAPFVVAGVSLASGHGGGLYWLVVGTTMSFFAALLDGWVLLIEIQR